MGIIKTKISEKKLNSLLKDLNKYFDGADAILAKTDDELIKEFGDKAESIKECARMISKLNYAWVNSANINGYVDTLSNNLKTILGTDKFVKRLGKSPELKATTTNLVESADMLDVQATSLSDSKHNLGNSISKKRAGDVAKSATAVLAALALGASIAGNVVLFNSNKSLENANAQLENANTQLSTENTELKNSGVSKEEYNDLLGRYNNIIAVIPEGHEAVEYINGLVNSISELNTEISALESVKTELDERIASLEAQLAEEKSKNEQNQAKIGELESELVQAYANYAVLEGQYNTAVEEHKNKVNELETSIATLEAENETYNGILSSIDSIYSEVCPNGDAQDFTTKFNVIIDYYSSQAGNSQGITDFLRKFVAEVGGVSYDSLQNLTPAELVEKAEAILGGFPSEPSEDPNANVREEGSSNQDTEENEKTEEEKENDGTGNVSPDLPTRE